MNILLISVILWLTLIIISVAFRESRKKKLPILFIHIPKTGGNSLKKTQLFNRCKYFGHKPILQIENYKSNFKFSFAVTRNPYDRVVSAFHYLKKGGEPNSYDLKMQKKLSKYEEFKDFVIDLHLFINEIHFKPQHVFVCDTNGRILVDYIFKIEKLDEEIRKLFIKERLPIEHIPRVNTSKHNEYSKYYNDFKIKNTVYQVYKKDFELFNY